MRVEHILVALRRRCPLLVAAPAIVIAGLGARAMLGGLAAKLAGDALYTVLVYILVLMVRPETSIRRAFAVAVGVSFAVEFAQLTPYPAILAKKHVLFRLVLGTTFGLVDLAGYVIGGLGAAGLHAFARRPRNA
ncbi:integral membrane protein [Minicystis rosea]|nr:integral membrane protein [Minicystis rosea]